MTKTPYYKALNNFSVNGGHTDVITRLISLESSSTSILLASSSKDGKIKIWNLSSLTLLHSIGDHFGSVESLAYLKRNKRNDGEMSLLASGSYDTTIKLWNITDNSVHLIQTLIDDDNGHSDTVVSLVFLDDGRLLASASLDKSVIVWDLEDNFRLKYKFNEHVLYVNVLVAIDDMSFLASGSGDATVNVYDISIIGDGKLKYSLNQHTDQIEALTYVGDGLLVSGSYDRTIKIWDLKNGGILKFTIDASINNGGIGGHTNWVTVLSSLNSEKKMTKTRSFASGSLDNTIKIWSIDVD